MKKRLGSICLLLCIPWLASAQLYLWPVQSWQEMDLVNPASVHEDYIFTKYSFKAKAAWRQKTFRTPPAIGNIDDWGSSFFSCEKLFFTKAHLLTGFWVYSDKFGATKLVHGSLRLGGVVNLSENSFLSLAASFGREELSISTSDLYFLQAGDPIQESDQWTGAWALGAGVFYRYQRMKHDGKDWGAYAGISMPAILEPAPSGGNVGGYNYFQDLETWHAQTGFTKSIANGRWLESSLWTQVKDGHFLEGSVTLRFRWLSDQIRSGKKHSWYTAAHIGTGYSSWGFVHFEAGIVWSKHWKVVCSYDHKPSPILGTRSLPIQLSLAYLGGRASGKGK